MGFLASASVNLLSPLSVNTQDKLQALYRLTQTPEGSVHTQEDEYSGRGKLQFPEYL
jgi:hypothetical protein